MLFEVLTAVGFFFQSDEIEVHGCAAATPSPTANATRWMRFDIFYEKFKAKIGNIF